MSNLSSDPIAPTIPEVETETPQPEQSLTAYRSIARRAVRGTASVAVSMYFNIIVGFASTLILTRLLSPEVFGFFSMANFWSGLLTLRPKFGLSYPAVRHKETTGELLGTYSGLNMIISALSLLLAGMALILLPLLGYRAEVVSAVVVLMVIEALMILTISHGLALDKELLLSRMAFVSLAGSVLAYATAISLAFAGGEVWSLVAIPIIPSVVYAIGVYWVARRLLPHIFQFRWRFNQTLAKQMIWQGLPMGLSISAVMVIASQFDNFLIGTFIGYASLGFYDRAYRMAHWPNVLLTTVVSRVAFVTFAKVQDDLPRLTHAVRLSLWILLTLGIPIALTVFFGANDLVYIFYGPKWGESAFYLKFLVIYAIVGPIVDLGFWLSAALGHTRVTMLITAIQSITLVVFATPLTLAFGIVGTLVGAGITSIAALTVSCYYIFRQVPLNIGEILGVPALATSVAASVLIILLNFTTVLTTLPPPIRLMSISIIGSGVFMIILFALRPADMIERVRYMWQAWNKV